MREGTLQKTEPIRLREEQADDGTSRRTTRSCTVSSVPDWFYICPGSTLPKMIPVAAAFPRVIAMLLALNGAVDSRLFALMHQIGNGALISRRQKMRVAFLTSLLVRFFESKAPEVRELAVRQCISASSPCCGRPLRSHLLCANDLR